jgi:type I restriction enzyme S subunit
MRELVLHLAVTGNLVRQNSTEQPAEDLLVQVRQSRDALVKEGTIRRIEALPPLTIDDVPFECPAGWAWVRFGEISSSFRGHNPPKSLFKDKPAPGYVRFIQQRDFRTDDYAVYVPESRHLKLVKKGEIVMAAYGNIGNTCRTVEGAFNVAIAKVMEIPPVARDYTDLLIRSDFIRGALEKVSSRVAVSSMSSDHMRSLAVPLPPLAEQKRIVAKVDELMALCDRLEAQQQERETRHAALARASLARFVDAPTPANLNLLFHTSYSIPPADLRKSILTLAVQGKLVPQDPNDEPAEEIVRRTEAERPDGADAPVDETEQPWSLPSCWTWGRLGAIANIKHGYAFSSESFTSEPTPFVLTTPGNFYESGGFRDRGANSKYFNGEVPPSFVFTAGDLIIPMTEQAAGLLGSPAFIPDDGKTYLHNQRLGKLEFSSDEIAPDYVFWFFNCEFFRSELARTCTGMKVRHTSPKRILKVPFPLPPLAEQRRIVAKVEQLMDLVDALEQQLAASRATAANLLAALVAELTGTPHNGKVSVLSTTTTGRRGRPPKSQK